MIQPHSRIKQSKLRCFTLTELMVAIAITSLVAFSFTQILNMSLQTFKINQQHMDATTQARFVLDRIKLDFDHMPKRMDMGYHMQNTGEGEDFLRFISQIKAGNSKRGVSLIGYKMDKDKQGYLNLYRGARGYNWDDKGFMGLDDDGQPLDIFNLPSEISLQKTHYDILASGVLKVALAFQTKNTGDILSTPPLFQFSTNQARECLQMTNIASVIVTLAIMDPKYKKIIKPDQLTQLSSRLSEPPANTTPITHWNEYLNKNFKQFSQGIPKEAAQSVRVFQRFYPME